MCSITGSPIHISAFHKQLPHPINSWIFPSFLSRYLHGNAIAAQGVRTDLPISLRGMFDSHDFQHKVSCWKTIDSDGKCSDVGSEVKIHGGESDAFLHVRTLKNFPIQELSGKVVMVRFDSTLLLREAPSIKTLMENKAHLTIKYLYNAGAKVFIVSNWQLPNVAMPLSIDYVADYLSSVLQLKVVPVNGISCLRQPKIEQIKRVDIFLLENLSNFSEELSNCSTFAEKLSSGVDIFVNDAFSQCHKVLASTVGVTRFCYASIAGFQFEEELSLVREITRSNGQPYIAIIGGSNLLNKSTALCCLASVCDGLVFVGRMAFQIMHALGYPVSSSFVEHGAVGDVSKIINLAQTRNIPILFPNDFWCINDVLPELCDLFPSSGILTGWTPVGLGPRSLNEIFTVLSKSKKVLWIGPIEFSASRPDISGASELAMVLGKISQGGCDVTVVGNAARKAIIGATYALSSFNMLENASVVWNFLKQRVLPGVAALDRAYPFELDWNAIFADPSRPLIVDIGSGNGLFLLRMASRWKSSNFLGLEINSKLVRRCLDSVNQSGLTNGYFLSTNATSTFRTIISSYPGELVLVSIQCPDPDFNKEEHRWRMLQRGLVEAIVDLLAIDGKIFLQSDIEPVALRMKELFIMYGKGKLLVMDDRNDVDGRGWLKENPFGVRSDWEQHVVDRGAPMYRLMLSKAMPM
ncbi:Phosphoglycerate kinase [Cinnamomum micranthum f. kanehirae]|uniref:Phosphoglycerate kinase n=1 Tax=Cinnamomum micranthum f. kanehirae TaxID=337451 RepID=A0A3S3LVA0_9MAGN|nr:Phosphoglycerate kinase [Cinnamomum micranthum f. kanehirae]